MMPCEALAGMPGGPRKATQSKEAPSVSGQAAAQGLDPQGQKGQVCGGFSMRRSRNEVRASPSMSCLPDSLPQESLLFIPVLRSLPMWRWL